MRRVQDNRMVNAVTHAGQERGHERGEG
jgi:hypothetical protein